MITEDYCSYEVAKLLKEKGFNESCYTYYDDIDNSINRFDKGLHFNNTSYPWGVPYDISREKKYIVAPTHQRAMKWLRKVHKLSIRPRYDEVEDEKGHLYYVWFFDILSMNPYKTLVKSVQGYPTYEQASDAGIKDCLEHLI